MGIPFLRDFQGGVAKCGVPNFRQEYNTHQDPDPDTGLGNPDPGLNPNPDPAPGPYPD